MRKLALLAALVLAATVGMTGVASAINGTSGLKIKLKNNKAGTKAKPGNVNGFTVDISTTPAANDAPFATKRATVHLDKNLVFGTKKFPSCTVAAVQQGSATCTPAKVGSGTAQGLALGQVEPLTVVAYNGPGGNRLLLHVQGSAPLVINQVIEGKLVSDSNPKYGKKLIVDIPAGLQQPLTNVYATLTSFVVTVKGKRKGTPYVGLKGCSGGKVKASVDLEFTDGSKQSADASVSCTKSRKK